MNPIGIDVTKDEANDLLWVTAANSVTGYLGGPRVMWRLNEALAVVEEASSIHRTVVDGVHALAIITRHGENVILLNLERKGDPWA